MKIAECHDENVALRSVGTNPNSDATGDVHSQVSVVKSHSNQPMPLAACATLNRSSVSQSLRSICWRSVCSSSMFAVYYVPPRIAFASTIARILPKEICRGRWLNPHVLVIIVCSALSQG